MSDAHIFPRSDMLKIQQGIATLIASRMREGAPKDK